MSKRDSTLPTGVYDLYIENATKRFSMDVPPERLDELAAQFQQNPESITSNVHANKVGSPAVRAEVVAIPVSQQPTIEFNKAA